MRAFRPVALLAALLAAVAVVAVPARQAAATHLPEGPDVASYQHPGGAPIDWQRVRASGAQFAFVKATEGTTYTNPYFAADWADSAAAGLVHGAYHYARPYADLATAQTQAQHFADVIGRQDLPGTLPPALDLEETGGLSPSALQQWTSIFLSTLQSLIGRTPMIYTYPSFWANRMGNSATFTSYPLWIANYGVGAPNTLTWPTWTFWQYTSSGTADGIATRGGTDLNRFNGTAQQLTDFALGPPPAPSPEPSPTATPTATISPTPSPTPSASPDPSPTPSPSGGSGGDGGTWGPPSKGPPPAGLQTVPRQSRYVGVDPVRVVDTRIGQGAPRGPTSRVTVQVPPQVPPDATGVVLNVSVVAPPRAGFLRAAATGADPTTTALNFGAGQSVTGLVVTAMSAQQQVTLALYSSPGQVVVDLVGYYTGASGSGGHYRPLPPTRFVDSRTGTGVARGPRSGDVTVQLPAAVPADAAGVVLDVSVVDPAADGYLRLAPTGTRPATTALNFTAGQAVTALALTRSSNRSVTVSLAGGAAQLVLDVVGYYDAGSTGGSSYVAVTPQRFLDTRSGLGATGPGRGPLTLAVPASVPPGATGVVLDVSVVSAQARGYLRLSAPGDTPTTTSLSFLPGLNTTGLAITAIRDGRVTLTVYGGPTQLVADLVGYHTG